MGQHSFKFLIYGCAFFLTFACSIAHGKYDFVYCTDVTANFPGISGEYPPRLLFNGQGRLKSLKKLARDSVGFHVVENVKGSSKIIHFTKLNESYIYYLDYSKGELSSIRLSEYHRNAKIASVVQTFINNHSVCAPDQLSYHNLQNGTKTKSVDLTTCRMVYSLFRGRFRRSVQQIRRAEIQYINQFGNGGRPPKHLADISLRGLKFNSEFSRKADAVYGYVKKNFPGSFSQNSSDPYSLIPTPWKKHLAELDTVAVDCQLKVYSDKVYSDNRVWPLSSNAGGMMSLQAAK